MKIRKRVLSAVLAATMLVTSLGTGLAVMAEEINNDPYRTLADALKADGVVSATWPERVQTGQDSSSNTVFTVTMDDATGDIEAAAEAFWAVATDLAPSHTTTGQNSDYNTLLQVKNEILDKLQNEYGVVGNDLSVAMAALDAFTAGQEGADGLSGFFRPSSPNKRYYKFVLVRGSLADQLLAYDDVNSIPETLYGAVEYSWFHDAQNGGSFGNYWRNLVLVSWTRTEQQENTEVPAAMKAFDAFFAEHLDDDLDAMTGDELQTLYNDAQAQINALAALGIWGNDEVMNHFFDKDAIEAFVNNVKTRIDIAYAKQYVAEIKNLMDAHQDLGSLSAEELNQLYKDLTAQRELLLGCTKDAQEAALTAAGLSWDQVNDYINSVKTEIDVDRVEASKAVIDGIIAGLPADLTQATDEQLQSAYAQATTEWANISDCTADAIARVFTEGTEYVTDLIHNLDIELQAREIKNSALEFGAFFKVHMETDLTTVATDDLLDNYRKPDREKFENEVKQYDPEALDRVYGEGWYASVEAYIASIDTTLTERVEAQIDEAVNNYTEFGEITIRNYRAVLDAIGGVETRIFEVITLSEEYQAKYDQFSAYSDELNAFAASKGLSNWKEVDVEYPTREAMPGDMARTAEETYSVDADKLNTVVSKIDSLMQNEELVSLLTDLGVAGLDGTVANTIKGAVEDNLYTNEMVNTVITAIYPALVDAIKGLGTLASIPIIGDITGETLLEQLPSLNINVYPGTLDDNIEYYVDNGHPEWAPIEAHLREIDYDWTLYDMNTDWGVHDQASFVEALSAGLSGLAPVLKVALTNVPLTGRVLGLADLTVDSMSLYDKAVYPLLQALGCENVVDVATYNTYSDAMDLLGNILNPLLTWVTETVANNPISTVLDILPKLAYIMQLDLITSVLKSTVIDGSITALGGLVNIDLGGTLASAFGGSNNLYGILSAAIPADSGIDLKALGDINLLIPMILKLVAPDANLVLPTIDQGFLASLGSIADAGNGHITYTSDKAAVLVSVLRYVLNMVGDQDFMDSLFALLEKLTGTEINLGDDVMNIITGLGANPDGVICALTELFIPQDYAAKEYTYKYAPASVDEEGNPLPINTVEYSENWTKDEAQYIADNLSEFVDNMMTILGGADMPSLGDMIRSYIAEEFYTNEMINTLVITIRDAINSIGIDLSPILALVDVDLSSWNNVTESTNWGVVPGDSVTFASGLSQALSPLTPVLSFLFTGKDISVLDTITANGYKGYQNGIVPLLENLGCNTAYIHSYDEYVARVEKDPSRALNDILDPILKLVDRIYQNPIDTIIDILPNLLYFIDCGGLQTAVENTAQAAFVLLDTVRPIYNISFDLNLNLQQIIVDLLANLEVNGQKLNLKIPFLNDLKLLMVGTVTEYNSKSGLDPTYMLMNTDKADFVTVLLRNVVDLIFYEENQKVITDLIANQAGLDQETADSLLEIFNTFATMYKEDNGVDKILHAAYVIFQASHETSDGALTEIKDFNERWNAVFEALEESGGFLADFANWADSVLDFLSFGLITGDGIGTSGLIDFFDRVAAFFQGRVTSVSIDRTSADMLVGQQTTLSLSFKPVTVKNKNAVWTSSNESAATVENGVVTAVGVGDTEIKATTEDGGFVVSCVVRVRADKTALNEAIALVESANLQGEQLAAVAGLLENAKAVVADELASQPSVEAAREALLTAFYALELGEKVTDVTITQNGAPVGEVVYQKVPWTKRWNTVPVTLGVQINSGALSLDDVKSVTWQYASWSVDKPEADIEANGMEATIRAKNSVVGAHSCWIQVTVEDAYGNTVTSNPVKVRFYNYDWQK